MNKSCAFCNNPSDNINSRYYKKSLYEYLSIIFSIIRNMYKAIVFHVNFCLGSNLKWLKIELLMEIDE